MSKEKNIHVQGEFKLRSSSFELCGSIVEKAELSIRDELESEDLSLDGFALEYKRTVSFAPQSHFEIAVQYLVRVAFLDDAGRRELVTLDSVKEWVNRNKVRIINTFGVPSAASALISSLMVQANLRPLVTPPYVIER